jgi:hypothetical protein
LGQHLGVTLAGDHGLDHLSAGDPEHVRDRGRQLDLGVFEDLLQPLGLAGLLADQVRR